MPGEQNLFDNDLIKANLIPADIKLYVVTKDRLKNITQSSIMSDLLAVLASISWGAFISFLIAANTSIDLTNNSSASLIAYKNVFLWVGLALTILFFLTKWNQYNQISGVIKSKLEVTADD